ncbi:M28 family peptidase [Chloroflexota bacterium]
MRIAIYPKTPIQKMFSNIIICSIFSFSLFLSGCGSKPINPYGNDFIGERAYRDIAYQVNLGPRVPGSEAHKKAGLYIVNELKVAGWNTVIQELEFEGQMIRNIIASRGKGERTILLGAHYDSRMAADRDPDLDKRDQPVIGANDGGSGVAVLLELARVLPKELEIKVQLVFFDAEDNGGISGWDWILGSRAYVDQLKEYPDMVIIIDMVGDTDLNIFFENNSNSEISASIWGKASELGYDAFIPMSKFSIIDDHTPFLRASIPAVDIIDFDYPYWHTSADTLDKVSAKSLEVVGDTLLQWILEQNDDL